MSATSVTDVVRKAPGGVVEAGRPVERTRAHIETQQKRHSYQGERLVCAHRCLEWDQGRGAGTPAPRRGALVHL